MGVVWPISSDASFFSKVVLPALSSGMGGCGYITCVSVAWLYYLCGCGVANIF